MSSEELQISFRIAMILSVIRSEPEVIQTLTQSYNNSTGITRSILDDTMLQTMYDNTREVTAIDQYDGDAESEFKSLATTYLTQLGFTPATFAADLIANYHMYYNELKEAGFAE